MRYRWEISLFAGLAEAFGTRRITADWPESELTAGRLKSRLMDMHPGFADLIAVSFVAYDQAYAREEDTVRCDGELALLPPVSGGSGAASGQEERDGRYMVTESPIDVNAVIAQAAHPDHGAVLIFAGTTREWTGGKRTVRLEYEAYTPMATAAMQAIGDEIAARWPGTLAAMTHRIGRVGIGEISVAIAVSSAHRAEAYEASRYAIERLKQTVPIWKKEVYEDGTEWKGHQLGPWDPLAPGSF